MQTPTRLIRQLPLFYLLASLLACTEPPTEGLVSASVTQLNAGQLNPEAWARLSPTTTSTPIRLEKSARIPMRDGIHLATDFYFPQAIPGPYPAIVLRTPYDKNRYRQPDSIASYFAAQGYVVVVQDVRGKFESEGQFQISSADRRDGYDLLSWIAAQRWSTGKIGTYGCSYLGENQMQLAAERHPNHHAALAQAAGGAYAGTQRPFMYREGGVPELAANIGWFWHAASRAGRTLPELNLEQAVQSLPVLEAMTQNGHRFPSDYRDYLSHPPGSAYWQGLNYVTDHDRFNVPTLHVNSWYDGSVNETLLLFNRFIHNSDSARAGHNQFAIISPAGHCGSERAGQSLVVGERELGDASKDYLTLYRQWFDHWLKGDGQASFLLPKVQYYLMGKNQWQQAPSWPLPNTDYQAFYLHSEGAANSLKGNGRLSTAAPLKPQADQFTYNPYQPVPSLGGPKGPVDQRPVESRDDVLVYTSAPLKQGLEVVGPISVQLYVSSSAPDTDFTVKLVDVYPDGRAFNLQEAILRARYRQGYQQAVMMKPSEVYPINISLHATANYFKPGHRIRVEVSSSNFPRYVRNLNTGGNNFDEREGRTALNRVHHGPLRLSHLLLPVINTQEQSP